MAKKQYGIDFEGFLDYAAKLDSIDPRALEEAVANGLKATQRDISVGVGAAMKKSKYSFKKGVKYSQGDSRESLIEISKKPVEKIGTILRVETGVDLAKAPEVAILMYGTPKLPPDKTLYRAIKLKSKADQKRIQHLQQYEFKKVLSRYIGGEDD